MAREHPEKGEAVLVIWDRASRQSDERWLEVLSRASLAQRRILLLANSRVPIPHWIKAKAWTVIALDPDDLETARPGLELILTEFGIDLSELDRFASLAGEGAE
jgi:hypothetical protein